VSDQKGTCCVCGKPAPDSVVCDDCFLKNWVRPSFAAIAKAKSRTTDGVER
jgi:NMD protein affecting ribosome stability and mRNA decay